MAELTKELRTRVKRRASGVDKNTIYDGLDYAIVSFPQQDNTNALPYYLVLKDRKVSFGKNSPENLFSAYPIVNLETAEIDTSKPCAVEIKETQTQPGTAARESEGRSRPARRISRQKSKTKNFTLYESPEKNFIQAAKEDNFRDLTFLERVELARELSLRLAAIHKAPSAGPASEQNGITSEDVMLNIAESNIDENRKKKFEIAIIQSSGESAQISESHSLTNLFILIFGGQNPSMNKDKIASYNQTHNTRIDSKAREANTPFYLNDLFSDITIPELPIDIDIKDLVIKFFTRMQSQDRTKKAAEEEKTAFFTALHELSLANAQDAPEDKHYEHAAKLILLAEDFWRDEYSSDTFTLHPELCKFIIKLSKEELLPSSFWLNDLIEGYNPAVPENSPVDIPSFSETSIDSSAFVDIPLDSETSTDLSLSTDDEESSSVESRISEELLSLESSESQEDSSFDETQSSKTPCSPNKLTNVITAVGTFIDKKNLTLKEEEQIELLTPIRQYYANKDPTQFELIIESLSNETMSQSNLQWEITQITKEKFSAEEQKNPLNCKIKEIACKILAAFGISVRSSEKHDSSDLESSTIDLSSSTGDACNESNQNLPIKIEKLLEDNIPSLFDSVDNDLLSLTQSRRNLLKNKSLTTIIEELRKIEMKLAQIKNKLNQLSSILDYCQMRDILCLEYYKFLCAQAMLKCDRAIGRTKNYIEALCDEAIKIAHSLNGTSSYVSPAYDIVLNEESYYLIDKKRCLGKGSFGRVYPAYRIDLENNTIETNEFLVAKVINRKRKRYAGTVALDKEVERQSKYLRRTSQRKSKNYHYIFSEYLGKNFFEAKKDHDLEKLTFVERTELAWQLALNINLIHHNTPSTGSALEHNDIKSENVMLKITEDHTTPGEIKKRFEVSIIDFDFAENSGTQSKQVGGSIGYMPPQPFNHKFGKRNDIFSLTCLFILIFGGTEPLKLREAIEFKRANYRTIVNTPFYFADILSKVTIPDFKIDIDIKKLLIELLNLTGNMAYELRPNNDVVLEFFNALHRLAVVNQDQDNDTEKEQYQYGAKLILIAKGVWEKEFGLHPLDPEACKAIVRLNNPPHELYSTEDHIRTLAKYYNSSTLVQETVAAINQNEYQRAEDLLTLCAEKRSELECEYQLKKLAEELSQIQDKDNTPEDIIYTHTIRAITNRSHDLEKMFSDLAPPKLTIDVDIETLKKTILNRMQDMSYENSANRDEVLAFFTGSYNFHFTTTQDNFEEKQYVYIAKLILLAEGLWKKEYSSHILHPELCKAIIKLHLPPNGNNFSTFDAYDDFKNFRERIFNSNTYPIRMLVKYHDTSALVASTVKAINNHEVSNAEKLLTQCSHNQYELECEYKIKKLAKQTFPAKQEMSDEIPNVIAYDEIKEIASNVLENLKHSDVEDISANMEALFKKIDFLCFKFDSEIISISLEKQRVLQSNQRTQDPNALVAELKGIQAKLSNIQDKLDRIITIFEYCEIRDIPNTKEHKTQLIRTRQECGRALAKTKQKVASIEEEILKSEIDEKFGKAFNDFVLNIQLQMDRLNNLKFPFQAHAEKKAKALSDALEEIKESKYEIIRDFINRPNIDINDKKSFYHHLLARHLEIKKVNALEESSTLQTDDSSEEPPESRLKFMTADGHDITFCTLYDILSRTRGYNPFVTCGLVKSKTTSLTNVEAWIKKNSAVPTNVM